MAYYGIPSAGAALTAASTNDKITIKDLGGTDVSAQSVYGADGNDVISLGAAGITATASAKIVVPNLADYLGTGAAKGGFISGNGGNGYLISGDVLLHGSAGTVYTGEGSVQISANGTGGTMNLEVEGIRTSDQAARTSNAAYFQANAGNDSIALGGELLKVSSTTFAGGAGNDIIGTYSYVNEQWAADEMSGTFISTNFEGGKGDDTINLNGAAVYSAINLNANQGNDLVSMVGSISGAGNSIIGLGAGNDSFSGEFVSLLSSTLAGGKGNDTISLTATTVSDVIIGGDRGNATNIDGDGNDSIRFDVGGQNFTGSTIYGGGGNDTITFVAAGMTASVVSLNKGKDIFSAEENLIIKDSTIGMGADNDEFHLVDSGAILSSRINLGKGADTTDFGGASIGSGSDFNATLYGGAGADVLLGSAAADVSDTIQIQVGYTDNSESTISAFDTIDFNVNASGTYQFRYDPGATIASFEGSNGLSGTNGVVTFSSTFANDAVTARAEALATNLSNGEAAAFMDDASKVYFFVKGASDNLLVQVGSAAQTDIEALTVSASKNLHLKLA